MRLTALLRRYQGAIFHISAGILVFTVWRITGMPAPGTQGRLIPLAWALLSLVSGRLRVHRFSLLFLTMFVLLSIFWRTGQTVELLAVSFAVLGMLPPMLSLAEKGLWGPARAVVPFFLLSVLLVPFEGDEPHYAALVEDLAGGGSEVFGEPGGQRGDMEWGESHHTKAFPLLLIPGYPLGLNGVRTVSFMMALASSVLLALLYRKAKVPSGGKLALMGMVLLPGAGILGLLYPGWLALGLFCAGALWGMKGRLGLPVVILVTLALTAIKFRFFFLGAGLLLVWFIRLSSPWKSRALVLVIGGAALVLAADFFLLGGNLFWNRYGNTGVIMLVWTNITQKTGSLILAPFAALLDIEAGMIWKAPWLLLSFAGLPEFRRRFPELFLRLGLPSLVYIAVIFLWMPTGWHSLPTPPGRLFIPLLPFMLASASMLLHKPSAKMLLWLSLLVTALCIANPWLRFNHADGTDALVTLFSGGSHSLTAWLPTQVRPALTPFLIWGAFFSSLVVLVKRTRWGTSLALLAASIAVGSIVRTVPSSWEAEDLGPPERTGCVIYPSDVDPERRNYWLFDRQMMLHFEHPSDRITLDIPSGDGDSVTVEIVLRGFATDLRPGIMISCGSSTFTAFLDSEVRPLPSWVSSFRRDEEIDRIPEILADTTLSCVLFNEQGNPLVIEPVPWADDQGTLFGLYLDRIEVRVR